MSPRRFVLPLIGLVGLAIFVALHSWSPDIYRSVLTAIMIRPFANNVPFVDLRYLFVTAECWQKGVDVYVINPCDNLGTGVEGYSPLWLRAPFLFAERPWWAGYGVILDGLFFVSLAALPLSRRWQDQWIVGVAAFSSVTVYGLERGNIDLIIFMMALTAGLCAARSAAVSMVGYGVLLLAGLLKFYPLAGMVLALREHVARFLIIAGISAAVVVAFVLEFHEELVKTAKNIPSSSYFGDNIAARQLPGGLGLALRSILHGVGAGGGLADALAASRLLIIVIVVLLCGVVGIIAIRFARQPASRRALHALPSSARDLLVLGAALISGCFFAGQSVSYRGILLLLVLPGLLALAWDSTDRRTRKISGWTVAAILLVMWRLTVIQFLASYGLQSWAAEAGGGSAIAAFVWIGFELVWWSIVAVLMAILAAFALDSPVGRRMAALIGVPPVWFVNEPT